MVSMRSPSVRVQRVRSSWVSHANPVAGRAATAMAPASGGTVASVVDTVPASACQKQVSCTCGESAATRAEAVVAGASFDGVSTAPGVNRIVAHSASSYS